MNTKDKAKELLKKILGKNPNRQEGISSIDVLYAKLCIITMIDELLNELDSQNHIQINYWYEVKHEIEKL